MNSIDDISMAEYQALAEFRYQIRRFLRFSEQAARATGLVPQQYQLLLALKGLPNGRKATISELAERLQIKHHSTVELIDRLVKRELVESFGVEPFDETAEEGFDESMDSHLDLGKRDGIFEGSCFC